MMATVEKTIEIDVPVNAAYNQWTQFESFPEFMEAVESVTQVTDTQLHWVAEVAGKTKEWDAQITEQQPDRRIAWESTSGARNAGAVTFEPLGADKTRLSLWMDVEPEGPVESSGAALGLLDRRVQGDLERFKKFIESRGTPTGAWRGEVQGSGVR
jgi:uncharacterized membrane protein